ncbi:hypothetical protein FPHYL_4938 [Fusarium phyllophilum]|uniref:Uncharacterized protein n=1 Tax=Fusarium phyllophilum TaxID=47803 RepID=A0A8H5K2L6_9HYPO|nr:hypothetical protein FPHYL_4938 [Fusarium phyllophilum]
MPRGRPPYLPAQENVENTYMDPQYIPAGAYNIAQINQGSLESNVRQAWSLILGDVFSMYEGFSIDHEADIQGRRVDMELKRYSYSNSDQALEYAEDQLKGYLGSLSNTRERMLWGALCIGKSVQFYQCSKEGSDVELFALHEGTFNGPLQKQDLINVPANGLLIPDFRSLTIEEYRKGCRSHRWYKYVEPTGNSHTTMP